MPSTRRSRGTIRLGSLVAAILVFGFFCAAGIGYVWHRNRNEQIGRQIQDQAAHLEQLRMQNQYLDRQLEELRSPRALEAAVRRFNLGLVMPQPEQILRITEEPPGASRMPAEIARIAWRTPAR